MQILILHGIDSVAQSRRTSLHHAFFLPRYESGHDYWLQAAHAPVPESLLEQKFDAIIIDTTFLCWRWTGRYFQDLKTKYDFIRDMDAVKIAFPQDEYDHTELLEDWLLDWQIDVVYSVCHSDLQTFYPELSKAAEVRFGYTGLFEAADLALVGRFAAPWRQRPIDVGYRARRLPPYFGWFGKLKSDIADRFIEATAGSCLKTNISCEPQDALAGNDWLKFLGNCRFILGCESGSSVLDSRGYIKARCEAFMSRHPDASFETIAQKCFPGEDRATPFTAISPRLFEAAAAGCGQILVPGHYDGLLQPWIHYIPLEADASNIEAVIKAMNDQERMEQMIRASQKALLENPKLTYRFYAADVMSAIRARLPDMPPSDAEEPADAMLRLVLTTSERWSADYQKGVPVIQVQRLSIPSFARKFARRLNAKRRKTRSDGA